MLFDRDLNHKISKVSINREAIRLNVRIVRMWAVPQFNNASQISSLELILMDAEGAKIPSNCEKKFAA